MPIISVQQYLDRRSTYDYHDLTVEFEIQPADRLPYSGHIQGIYASVVPAACPQGINLRKFEIICQSVFQDWAVGPHERDTISYENLRQVTCAIVHWKLASQGGRANLGVQAILDHWDFGIALRLRRACATRGLNDFCMPAVKIPTASAFLRFLFPNDYGIMDSRVVGNWTQQRGITTLSLGQPGNRINYTLSNVTKYTTEYIPFLRQEANSLNEVGAQFADIDDCNRLIKSAFRPCDIEMALFA